VVKSNKFKKALKHLKTDLSEAPTNSMGKVYSANTPGHRVGIKDPHRVFYPDIDGNFPAGVPGTPGDEIYVRPRDYWDEGPGTVAATDWDIKYDSDYTYESQSENPRQTDTLIDPDTGYVKSELPPGTRSFILGPIVDSYVHVHGYDNITRVGYIQKDTREFVLLGYVEGLWGDDDNGNPILQDGFGSASGWRKWDGQESSFTSVNSNFTFEHLQWFHNKLKSGRYIANVSFFLSGGLGCILGHGGDRQPPGSTQGNTPGGGGPPGSPPPKWPKNMGGDPPPPNPPPYGGPPNQSPPPNDGEPQEDPRYDTPPTDPYPKPPRKRRKNDKTGEDPSSGKRDTKRTKTDSEDDEIERDTGDEGEGSPPLTIDDFEKAAEYSAYKAGGGDAARAQGKSVEEIITQGIKNISVHDSGARNPSSGYTDYRPNYKDPLVNYKTEIAGSVLQNKPLNVPQSAIPQRDIDALVVDIEKYRWHDIPVNTTPQPYSDDNIYELPNGAARAHTPETRAKYGQNTGFVGGGFNNPLGGAGKAQVQLVVPPDGSEPYFKYTDHAYHNTDSSDPHELPGEGNWFTAPVGWVNRGLSDLTHALGRHDLSKPNTGDMKHYPQGIRGDVRKDITVPYSKLPKKLQEKIRESGYVPPTDTSKSKKQGKIDKNATTKSDFMRKMSSDHVDRENARRGFGESRTVSREQRRKILREVKQPYVLPETKKEKYKPNFKGKFSPQNTPDVTASPESDYMVRAKNAAGQTWRTKDKYWAGYETTERLNVVYDQVGHGQMYWDNLVKENQEKKNVRDRKIQEHLNILAHNRAMNKLDSNYESPFNANDKIEEQETLQADNDPLFRKVAKSLKKEIDYQDKPAKLGYPNTPPPQLDPNTGMHPDYGKVDSRYNSLDPHSANAMPPTGNPEIDAKVKKARRLKSVKSIQNK